MKKIGITVVCVVIVLAAVFIVRSHQSNIANTVRYSLDYYRTLQLGTPFSTITEKIGQPDFDTGSGIHIFVYKLSDGSEVWLGYADPQKLMYVKHRNADGTTADLVTK